MEEDKQTRVRQLKAFITWLEKRIEERKTQQATKPNLTWLDEINDKCLRSYYEAKKAKLKEIEDEELSTNNI